MSGFIGLKSSTSLSTNKVWMLMEYDIATTITVPAYAKEAVIIALGGGGSGAVSKTLGHRPSGGAGGAFVFAVRPVTPGAILTLIPGAAGAAPLLDSDGVDGGASTVSGFSDGSVVTAPGGEGGKLDGTRAIGGEVTVPAGDITFKGGDGGEVTADGGASGGGAPGTPYGPGGKGGDVATAKSASGGGASGEGNGGDIPAGAGEFSASGGGALRAAAPALESNGLLQQGQAGNDPWGGIGVDSSVQGFEGLLPHVLFAVPGHGNSGLGTGSSGKSATTSWSGSSPLIFGGQGGYVMREGGSSVSNGSPARYGAGGGVVRINSSMSTPSPGRAGDGAGGGGIWGDPTTVTSGTVHGQTAGSGTIIAAFIFG